MCVYAVDAQGEGVSRAGALQGVHHGDFAGRGAADGAAAVVQGQSFRADHALPEQHCVAHHPRLQGGQCRPRPGEPRPPKRRPPLRDEAERFAPLRGSGGGTEIKSVRASASPGRHLHRSGV
eukprot:1173532-Prorocentrum_minimum.AAC.2